MAGFPCGVARLHDTTEYNEGLQSAGPLLIFRPSVADKSRRDGGTWQNRSTSRDGASTDMEVSGSRLVDFFVLGDYRDDMDALHSLNNLHVFQDIPK